MAGARQRQRQRRRAERRSGAPRRPPEARGGAAAERRECVQSQRERELWCSSCDETHTLLHSCDGRLSECWTSDKHSKTRLVKELGNHDIVQIACGDHHSMALSRGGELFSWGRNVHGQLGVGSQDTLIPKPQLVEGLKGIPLAQIAAGGAHSVAVSLSGAVYSWGKNSFGQLGLGHTEDRDFPSYIKALEHWKAVFISCGADHTAVLSKDGLVCTFGAGGAGQLGHNSTQNELTPRVVAELWGARVSLIACGRQHTLVYVPSLDKVYSFGSDERQLGSEREANQLIPLPINSPVDNGQLCQENNTSQNVIKTTAEGKESVVFLLKKRNSYPLNGIATLEKKEVDAWISYSSPHHWETTKKNIRLIFSSEACISGSFLKRDKHFTISKEISGVDMAEVLRFYKKISKKAEVYQEVQNEIENLLPSLSSSPISPENFRVYLILPFLLQKEDNSSYHTLRLLVEAILRLQQKDLQTLECLWSNLETDFFKQLVTIFKRFSLYTLYMTNVFELYRHGIKNLQIMQILYQANSRSGSRLQDSDFYMPEMKEIVQCFCLVGLEVTMLIKYPCICDMGTKMFIHFIERNSLSTYINVHPSSIQVSMIRWVFPVRRECLLHDIWNHLRNTGKEQFKRFLQVEFVGEEGRGAGPSRELFSVAGRALCDPQSGVFRHFPSGLVWFPREVSSHGDTFVLVGTLFGMALYNGCQVPLPFPRALFKKIRDIPPTLEDLEELMPAAGRNLRNILNEESEHELESLHMTFEQMEEGGSMVELKKNGANILVTKHNRKEFVDLCVNYMLNESIRKPFKDFMQGFLRGCPSESWKMFLPVELQVVLLGHANYDWRLLEKCVKYIDYKKSHQTIKNFWTVFRELPEEKKKKFLAFLKGSDRIPPFGLEYFQFFIQDPKWENPDNSYPSACTCEPTFFLPRYSSKEILEEKFLYAIEHCEAFGLH